MTADPRKPELARRIAAPLAVALAFSFGTIGVAQQAPETAVSADAAPSEAERIADLRRQVPWGALAQADGVLGGVGAFAVYPRWKGILPLGEEQTETIVKLDDLVREARTIALAEAAEHPAKDYPTYKAYVDRIRARQSDSIEHAQRMVQIALLTPDQAKLVEQRNEWGGFDWLTLESERSQDLLDVTKDQRRKLEEVFDEFAAREGTWEVWNSDEEVRNKARCDRMAFREEIEANARKVLTPEQADEWSMFVAERTLPEDPPELPWFSVATSDLVDIDVEKDSPIFRVLDEYSPSYIGISPYQKRLLDDLAEVTRTGLFWIELQEQRDNRKADDVDSDRNGNAYQTKSAEFLHHAEQIALVGILSPDQAARYWKLAQELKETD